MSALYALGAAAVLAAVGISRQRGSRALDLRAAEVEDADISELGERISEAWLGITYYPSKEDLDAIQWVGRRYSSTSYLLDHLRETTDRTVAARPVTVIDIVPDEFQWALAEDNSDRLPMLSDDLPIQVIAFLLAPHDAGKFEIQLVMALEQMGLSRDESWGVVNELAQTIEGQRLISRNRDAEQRALAVVQQYPHLIPQQIRRRIAAQQQ